MEQSKPDPGSDWVVRSTQPGRIERIEAWFGGHGYQPHRHDTYSIGRTLSGVQSFHYKGTLRHGLPGNTLLLHPDELHDGMAGTEAGFHYRMAYIDPALIQQVLKGEPLPFIAGGLSSDPRLYRASEAFVQAMDHALDPLEEQDALFDLAMALRAVAGKPRGRKLLDYPAAERAREFIMAHLHQSVTLEMLEHASGREKWSLSRDFRVLFGTSPYRFVTLRRLDVLRTLVLDRFSLVDAALAAGFHDQSHMTRHFTRTYGVSPSRWLERVRTQGQLAGSYKHCQSPLR
ncbi:MULTISPECIES: AraC family transcriptional regulator [unclassified Pseudomonas]|jgi:AraC-like DNA-binding protein|uniref:AraC family transcriptional regulator n=1 Tax=unclassified Pseudomonas TaxID=196821 RepID=UPI000C8685C6|nr:MULTISPECIES: AraC family transcriptional regulator [unclassified Pseudomonas]MDX9674215.1 AraC family transcriptional regulator [Pseudomonas sp. P8_250]PMQ09293.1 Virulence regulon transcriptional activator VirF [Pseudomonas sp. AD21]WPN37267.1 AraC family transcriptional regulator [Pseudomonas sp. P8_139]WPN40931.1 AraC family transcriptional regulator [Pseudomonas sp. P8_229]